MNALTDAAAVPAFVPTRPIVMIGPMAVGKSVIGSELARTLGIPFIDTDQAVVAKHGPIARIFSGRGESHFRQLEARAVAHVIDVPTPPPLVLSLGGGAVLDSGTQQLLARATVVYLRATLDSVRERILRNTGRPLLAADPLATWERLARLRGPVYDRLADLTLDVGTATIPELVTELLGRLAAESRKENPQP